MAQINRQPKWDIYEAVVLLDGYIESLQGGQAKAKITRRISSDLRVMAVNRGIEIDDVYRNENGISYQIQSMDSAYKGERIYVPATKLFDEAVALYRTDNQKYQEILEEARALIAAKRSNKDAFMAWVADALPIQRTKWIEENILKMEQLAIAAKIISSSIFEVSDVDTLRTIKRASEKNKIFQIKNRKLIKNINEDFHAYVQFCSEQPLVEVPVESTEEQSSEPAKEITIQQSQGDSAHLVDFTSEETMAFTKPRNIYFEGKKLSIPSSWKDVYVSAVAALYEKHPDVFDGLASFPGSTRLEFCEPNNAYQLVSPKAVSDKLCVETNFSATDFVKRIKTLLDMSGEDYGILQIEYEKRAGGTTGTLKTDRSSVSSNAENAFFAYLQNTAKLAERTCMSYTSSVRGAERFAREHGYNSYVLFTEDRETIIATAKELYGDADFIRYNEQQHNRFSAAINKLLESIDAEIPEKAVASCEEEYTVKVASVEANVDIVKVLKKHYEYGFKYDSIRELMRFRKFAEALNIVIPESDEELKESILASGTIIEDKVYCKSDDMPQELQAIINEVFSSGASVIYYDCLFEIQQEWMSAHIITSSEMLKEYFQKNIAGCTFSKKFFVRGSRRTEKDIVTEEIKRIWGESPVESVDDLSDRLPYIPLHNIWRVISGNNHFVLASEGVYLLIDRFNITEEEEEDILDYVETTCEEKGFASLSDVPLGSIEETNYELTPLVIYNAVYKKVLSGRYQLNSKILTKDDSKLDTVILLKQYLQNKDACTFDEVSDKVVELTGGTNRVYAFQALYDEMVRVDKNHFIANRLVNFNVDEIDAILSGFVIDHFCAIRDVTTFAMFPICGQSWNHYLLESFCYKYSRKYSLHVIHLNDKNAGIIAEKDYNKQYNEMLSMALARSDVELTPEIAGQYLFDTGYMAKSKYAKLDEIVQRALELRKER